MHAKILPRINTFLVSDGSSKLILDTCAIRIGCSTVLTLLMFTGKKKRKNKNASASSTTSSAFAESSQTDTEGGNDRDRNADGTEACAAAVVLDDDDDDSRKHLYKEFVTHLLTSHPRFDIRYCRMLNVGEHLSWRFGYVWCSWCLNLASVTCGVLFSYARSIFGKFYFSESKEPRETCVIKLSRKLNILQYATKYPWLELMY